MLNAIRAAPVCGRVPLFVPLCVVFNGMGELGVCGVLSCVSPVGAWFRRTVPQRTEALSGGGRVGGSRVPRSCTREGLTRRVVASTRCTACRRSRMRASGSTPRMPSTASSKSRSRCSRKLLAFRERGGMGRDCPGYGRGDAEVANMPLDDSYWSGRTRRPRQPGLLGQRLRRPGCRGGPGRLGCPGLAQGIRKSAEMRV